MSVDGDIELIMKQEQALQFSQFTEEDAWTLGSLMRAEAAVRNLPLVIDIRIGDRQMFFAALPGTAEDNTDWARRKVNTVKKIGAASYRIGLQAQKDGRDFLALRGLSPLDFTVAGGSFPIAIRNVGMVGTVTVSGIPQRQDHGFVVECLCKFLKVDHKSLALSAGND